MQTLILLRGLPGSGKTTVAVALSWATGWYFYEADQYFINCDGVYKFDARCIKHAHIYCQSRTDLSLSRGESVIVSNTFTQEWEMQPYIEMAKKYNARFVSLIVENRHGNANVHDVPNEVVKKMNDRFEVKL